MSATPDAIELARTAARAAAERKAEQIIAIDVSERLALTDVFLIVSGANDRQVRSIVDAVDEAMFKAGAKRKMREGFDEARWVLIDYGDIVVHVQQTEDREFPHRSAHRRGRGRWRRRGWGRRGRRSRGGRIRRSRVNPRGGA